MLALLSAGLLPALVPAQAANEATDAVRFAFQDLRNHGSIRVRLTGTEKVGSASTTISAELYWHLRYDEAGQPIAKFEYTDHRDGILVQRAVGDGKTFYNYSPLKNEYWVAAYGSHGPAAPARYIANLVDEATAGLKGSTTYLGRLLREVYAVNGFRAWIPGAQERLIEKDETMQDPVVHSRWYAGTEETQFGVFWFGNPAKRSLAFEFDMSSGARELKNIYFSELSDYAGAARVVDWRAEIFKDVIPAAGNFVFVPPANARITMSPRPSIG